MCSWGGGGGGRGEAEKCVWVVGRGADKCELGEVEERGRGARNVGVWAEELGAGKG